MTTLVFGYFDLNFGDDWLIRKFSEEYCKKDIILVVSDKKLFSPFLDKPCFRSIGNVGKINAIFRCKEICIVGGSMFQESDNWFSHYSKILLLLTTARLLGKKNYIVGCNLNIATNKKLNFLFKMIFKQIHHFRVRDVISSEYLSDNYGVRSSNVEISLDLADRKIKLTNGMETDTCAISIINNKNIDRDKYFRWLVSNIKRLQDEGVSKFTFFAFDSGLESDEIVIDDFISSYKNHFKGSTLTKHIYNGDVDSFITIWSKSKYALCTRFHSYILARNCEQNFAVYSYSKKIVEYIHSHHPLEMEFVDAS